MTFQALLRCLLIYLTLKNAKYELTVITATHMHKRSW